MTHGADSNGAGGRLRVDIVDFVTMEAFLRMRLAERIDCDSAKSSDKKDRIVRPNHGAVERGK